MGRVPMVKISPLHGDDGGSIPPDPIPSAHMMGETRSHRADGFVHLRSKVSMANGYGSDGIASQ